MAAGRRGTVQAVGPGVLVLRKRHLDRTGIVSIFSLKKTSPAHELSGGSPGKEVPVMVDKETRDLARKEHREVMKPEKGFFSPFEEMERWFEEAFRRPFFAPSWMPRLRIPDVGTSYPSVDIFEDGNDVIVKAELPGMKKEDIEVNISDDVITISGEKKTEEKVEKKVYYRLERSFGSFTRTLRLPAETRTDRAKASFRDGILEIRLPKTEEEVRKVKKITVE
jgi:HSP20 family protein